MRAYTRLIVIGVMAVSFPAACAEEGQPIVDEFTFPGASMSPTIKDGTPIEVLDYSGQTPQRGDVIAFVAPISITRKFVKRVIALPGDSVEIEQPTGEVRVNGEIVDEAYAQGLTSCVNICSWRIPPAIPGLSVSYARLDPRPKLPPGEAEDEACAASGCYFVLGDNRQNSSDSRQGWLVPAENIIGRVDVSD